MKYLHCILVILFTVSCSTNDNVVEDLSSYGILKVNTDIPGEVIKEVEFDGNNGESSPITVSNEGGILLMIKIPLLEFKKGFTITVYTESGKIISKSYNSPFISEPNVIKEVSFDVSGTDIISFELSSGDSIYPAFLINDTCVHVKIPNNCNPSSLHAVFEHNGLSASIDSVGKSLSDFNSPVRYIVNSITGETKFWTLVLHNIPVMIIETPNKEPIDSRDYRVEGCLMVQVDDDGTIDTLGTAGIKGRGNWLWTQSDKKSYNIKLEKKKSVMGMNKSKHWNLISNALLDRTQLHNAVALKIANLTDYKWTPKGGFCELLLNGDHLGLYYLCEKIRVEKGKIDIKEIGANDLSGEALTGGYMIESTIFPEEAEGIYFSTKLYNTSGGYPLYWFYDVPEGDEVEIPQVQQDYLMERLNHLEYLLSNEDSLLSHKYNAYLDIESLINWFLIEEVTQNEEASRSKNVRIYKDRGDEHFYIGPPWDFDAWSFGYANYNRWLTKEEALYLPRLFKDPLFVHRVKEKWNIYKPIWENEGLRYLEEQYKRIYKSAKRNDSMWPEWHGNYSKMTFEKAVEEMHNALIYRIKWMDERIQKW